jgi:TM2 domain-containing membrane protein YozV
MEMENEYKSPWSALLWSFSLPGFGQFYNRSYILGFTLIVIELAVNTSSFLNLSLVHTYHWDLQKSHDVVDFQWGLFYPSLWGFSMWEAFNKAKAINRTLRVRGVPPPKDYANYTGLLFGGVIGMNMGLLLHHILTSPVLTGLIFGVTGGIVGHFIERCVILKRTQRQEKQEGIG